MAIISSTLPPFPAKLHDFRVFLFLVWRSLGLPDPTPLQLDVADWFQHGPRRKLIEGFRGVAKSWIASAYVVWKLRLAPDYKFLVTSASKDRADNFSTFTLRLIHEIPVLQCLAPRPDQRNSKISFDVGPAGPDHSPSVKSVGIFGQLTGTRADEILGDDVEVPNNALTQGMRDRLSEAVKEFDAILKPGGVITYLGTPQTEQSLYNVLPSRGYTVRVWPARYPDLKQQESYGERLAPLIQAAVTKNPALIGRSTEPLRFTDDDLMERELSYGRAGFSLQFMLDTSLSDADRYPLKLRDLLVLDADLSSTAPEKLVWASSPELAYNDLPCVGLNGDRYFRPLQLSVDWLPFTGAVLAIDPAGRGKDETAYAVVKMLNGYLFLVAAGGFSGGYSPETLKSIAVLAKTHAVNKVIVEANFGDGMFTELLKPHLYSVHRCLIEEVRHSKQKELRIIDTLEPVISSHRLVVAASIIRADYESTKNYPSENAHRYQLFWQLSHITRDRGALAQDDRLDAVAMAVGDWVAQMAQDVDKKVQERQEDLLRKELEVFMGTASAEVDRLALEGLGGFNMGAGYTIGVGAFDMSSTY